MLAESILVFCWLTKLVFDEADPKPATLRLAVGFDNLTRPAGPATLRDAPESRFPGGHLRSAPDKGIQVHYPAEMEGYDPTRMAYLLIEEIYHWFGFDSQAIPYVDKSGAWVWLFCDDGFPAVFRVQTSLFLGDVKRPVGVEVAAEIDGAKPDDGFGHSFGPAHA